MTRREVEKLAEAVREIGKSGEPVFPANISIAIGTAVLGRAASAESWRKWLRATGWPSDLVAGMAENLSKKEA